MTFTAPLAVQGFGGLRLAGQVWGSAEDPPVVLVHGQGSDRAGWAAVADALAAAGRYVLAYDLRGHGESQGAREGDQDLAAHVGDLRAVLGQLNRRPVILGEALGALIALTAAGEGGESQASGLILVDPQIDARNISPVRLPTLVLHGPKGAEAAGRLGAMIDEAELAPTPTEGLQASDDLDAFNAVVLEFLERRAPRAPLVYRQGSSPRLLRDALGCFSTGVTVVTARRSDGALVGFTANSFTSVSLDPPLILICLAKTSSNAELFAAGPDFAVHVLHIGQQQVSSLFSRSGADKFADLAWETWETGAPIIQGALAALECTHYATHEGGDHMIIVGRVGRAHYEPQRDPLLFFRGRYRRLHFQ